MQAQYKEVDLFTDGGIRHGNIAIGFIAFNPTNYEEAYFSESRLVGDGTSNTAEYKALIFGLLECLQRGISIVHVHCDSQLIIKQIQGSFKANKPELKECRDCVVKLLLQFDDVSLKWIPRNENKRADSLVNMAFKRRESEWETAKQKRRRLRRELRRKTSKLS